MTMRKAFDDADDILEGIKGRRPTQSKPTKVVDDLNGVVIISKGEAQQAKRAHRAADIEEVRVKKVLEKEERRKSAEQLKVLGQEDRKSVV